MSKANYRLKFGKQESSRLLEWKEAVKRGERKALTPDEMEQQAAYRKRALARGRQPKSFEMREAQGEHLRKQKRARDQIEQLRMIKEFSEL